LVLQNNVLFFPGEKWVRRVGGLPLPDIPVCVLEKLEEIRDQERKEDTFTPMPSPYYMELTKLLLN